MTIVYQHLEEAGDLDGASFERWLRNVDAGVKTIESEAKLWIVRNEQTGFTNSIYELAQCCDRIFVKIFKEVTILVSDCCKVSLRYCWEDCLAGKVNNMREAPSNDLNNLAWLIIKEKGKPDSSTGWIERNAAPTKFCCKLYHKRIIVRCIIQCNPPDLLDKNLNKQKQERRETALPLNLTFDAIPIRSRTCKNACARCSPVWLPGTRWKPIKSARSFNIYCWPLGVWIGVVSIQWAVTAMKGKGCAKKKSRTRGCFISIRSHGPSPPPPYFLKGK